MGHQRRGTIRAHNRGYRLTTKDQAICEEIYRDDLDAPLTLERRYRAGDIPPAVAAALTADLWRNKQDRQEPHYPTWIDMFHLSGFTTDCEPDEPPHRPAVLFRGATVQRRAGPAWSYDPNQAHYFATQRQEPGTRACVWMAQVPAELMLARYLNGLEKEVVVDARTLTPIPLDHTALERATRYYRMFRSLGRTQVAFPRRLYRTLARDAEPRIVNLPPLITPPATTDHATPQSN